MCMGLQILAAVISAGRALWPRGLEWQGGTVLLNVGQLRTHDVMGIMGSTPAVHRSLWVMIPKSDREASLELLPAGDVNELNRQGNRYWVLDLRLGDHDG